MECTKCRDGQVFIETGIVQGQGYGPESGGYFETCPECGRSGEIPAPTVEMDQTQIDLARIAMVQNL